MATASPERIEQHQYHLTFLLAGDEYAGSMVPAIYNRPKQKSNAHG
jgi:hypothetical protein